MSMSSEFALKQYGAICPICNDYLESTHIDKGNYIYSCFGCDKKFKFIEIQQ